MKKCAETNGNFFNTILLGISLLKKWLFTYAYTNIWTGIGFYTLCPKRSSKAFEPNKFGVSRLSYMKHWEKYESAQCLSFWGKNLTRSFIFK